MLGFVAVALPGLGCTCSILQVGTHGNDISHQVLPFDRITRMLPVG